MSPRERSEITLFIPALLGPVAGVQAGQLTLPELPGLQRWIGAARRSHGPSGQGSEVLQNLFGVDPSTAPVAPVSYWGVTGQRPATPVLRADPVYLRVETDHLLLFDASALTLSADEAAALVARFNEFYAEDGLRLEAPFPNEWYLFGADALDAGTTPLYRVHARNVGPFLPAGKAGARLRALMNEVQMLFFEHPVNQARGQTGALPVSGIWPWGEGTLPERLPVSWGGVWADDSYARGLATVSETHVGDRAASWREWTALSKPTGRQLIVLNDALSPARRGDVQAWTAALASLDEAWFQPLVKDKISGVCVVTGDGRAFYARRRLWPWPTRASLSDLLHSSGAS